MATSCECPAARPGPTLASTCGGGPFMLFMGLLEVFLRSQCDIEDPCGRPKANANVFTEYDFVVVGGGSAGCVVASRLSEIPEWNVLLVEAGLDEPTGTQIPSMFLNYINSDIDWRYTTEPEKEACLNENESRCYWPRGKVLGGTSAMNGMMYMRGSRHDYDQWAALGAEGWSYNDVLPFFLKSEDNRQIDSMDGGYHAEGGPVTVSHFPYHPPLSNAILEAAEELGYQNVDLNGRSHTGFMIAQTTNRNGTRLSASRAFITPHVNRRPNLHLLLNATVTKVLINKRSKSVYGIEMIDGNGKTTNVFARKEVILSGGAINSPQLLLLSGIGPKDDLVKLGTDAVHHLPGVGRNLMNHVAYFVPFYVNDTNTTPLNWATAMEYLLFRDGLMSGTGISEVTGFVNSHFVDPEEDNPDLQLFFSGFLADCARTGQIGERTTTSGVDKRQITIIPVVIRPKSRGCIKLNSTDAKDKPRIYAGYYTHPDDVKVMLDGIKFVLKFPQTNAMKRYGLELDRTPVRGCENHSFGSDSYWICAAKRQTGPENHQAGTCKIGLASDPYAVVDNRLQVHGIDRLRVIDASVMPVLTSGNTHAPTMMIGEKGSDMIKQRWLTPDEGFFYNDLPSQRIGRHWGSW